MMPQMEANQPEYQQPSSAYGTYEGNRGSSQQQYEVPHQIPRGEPIDDNFVEVLAQRIAQYMSRNTTGKVYGQAGERGKQLSSEHRTAIAIFSVLALIPLGIVLGQQGPAGLIALGIVCVVIFM